MGKSTEILLLSICWPQLSKTGVSPLSPPRTHHHSRYVTKAVGRLIYEASEWRIVMRRSRSLMGNYKLKRVAGVWCEALDKIKMFHAFILMNLFLIQTTIPCQFLRKRQIEIKFWTFLSIWNKAFLLVSLQIQTVSSGSFMTEKSQSHIYIFW